MKAINAIWMTATESGALPAEDAIASVSATIQALATRGLGIRRRADPFDPEPGQRWEPGEAIAIEVDGAPLGPARNMLYFHEAWKGRRPRFVQSLAIQWSDAPDDELQQGRKAALLLRAIGEQWAQVRSVSHVIIRGLGVRPGGSAGAAAPPELDLGWWTWLGPIWVERLGPALIEGAPVHRVSRVGNGLALQLTEHFGEELSSDLLRVLRAAIPSLPECRLDMSW